MILHIITFTCSCLSIMTPRVAASVRPGECIWGCNADPRCSHPLIITAVLTSWSQSTAPPPTQYSLSSTPQSGDEQWSEDISKPYHMHNKAVLLSTCQFVIFMRRKLKGSNYLFNFQINHEYKI